MLLKHLLTAALATLAVSARQRTFTTTDAGSVHTLTSSIPAAEHPDGGDFTAFKHHAFPGYGIRIKRVERGWCEKKANSYTGYIDVDGHGESLFFYFFESVGGQAMSPSPISSADSGCFPHSGTNRRKTT